ncbi:RagB/SusD family nutrient uptake outer membrane protein [Chitinophagaceae bacterium 26-R-25]|nr:RagB/SusD family nutrient uptake outer membrane protein [Chitinophagaceae bacterium 26-R-25]
MKIDINKILVYSLGCCMLITVATGCSKYLDKKPDNLLTSDMIWQTRANAEAYLNNIYGNIQCPTDDYSVLGASDETSCSIAGVNVRKMISGDWNAQSYYWSEWGTDYAAIRKSIVFEENIDKVPASALSNELKAQYKSEAIFLRGWFYWKMLRKYGPFVKIDHTLSLNEDYNKYPRAPFDSCVGYIYQLMDKAASGLPVAWDASANLGRPTKGACMAVKSQVALLAASPLWNGNTKLFSNFKNADGTALAPLQKDDEKWKRAAKFAKDIIDANTYKLFTNLDEGDAEFEPYLSYRDLFLTASNSEIIFSSQLNGTAAWSGWIWGLEKRCAPNPGGINMQNATQNVVDAFYMRNGRMREDPLSGYTETGFATADDPDKLGASKDNTSRGYKKGNSMMYVDREARFYVAIQYNGKPVLPATTADDKNYFSSDANKDGYGRAEFYYSGLSGVKINGNGDITGYDALKGVNPASNIRNEQVGYRPFIHIRLAEIYLNYIEALNEYDPSNADILKYLNRIRERAGLPDFETLYPSTVGNQVEMRKVILRERQIEMCFEGDRYFTLIRRLMMGDTDVKAIYRMNVTADDGGQGFGFADFYQRKLFQTRYWSDRMYMFPIDQSDIDKDNAIVQNPGW